MRVLDGELLTKARATLAEGKKLRGWALRRILVEGVLFADLEQALAEFRRWRRTERAYLRFAIERDCPVFVLEAGDALAQQVRR